MFSNNIPIGKRFFDLLAAGMLLLLVSPILLVVAVLVRIQHGKPVLFGQKRPGYRGRAFFIYKFRSMTNARAADG